MKHSSQEFRQINIEQLVRSDLQPRQHFDDKKLNELADAIKSTNGLLQPIVVRPINENQYEIIAGERRWRAAMIAGLDRVSCLVMQFNDQQALEAAIIENVNRADLNPIEEAEAYQRLVTEFGYLHEEIATTIGTSRVKITNSLRMLKLDKRVQEFLKHGKLSEGHGKILAGLPVKWQYEVAQQATKNSWSVRRTEQEAKKRLANPGQKEAQDPNIKSLEKSLSDHLACKVRINCEDSKKGKLEISFHDIDILQGVFEKMGFGFS